MCEATRQAPAVRGLVAPAASAARGASTVRTAQTRRAADVVKPFTLGAACRGGES